MCLVVVKLLIAVFIASETSSFKNECRLRQRYCVAGDKRKFW